MRERNTIELKGLTAEREDKIVVMPFCQQDVEMHDHDFFELAYITEAARCIRSVMRTEW